ncbi:zinc finger protein 511 [Fopius arisanus]|uniref:Zinc finger protein 511 n=1 Tax=Fopius arisanus TaxID=64838 RepID=A0A9R1TD66_9HYME|nr:PREDICTED: zinc finger protein 511 [Fopius arisanus]
MNEFSCNAPGCTATFKTLVDFEMHYNGCHSFTCMECRKSRPTERLLDIHIQETHDSFFRVLAEKKPMYQCFVSDCHEKFLSPVERREHTMQIHKFPSNYRYDESLKQKSSKETKEKLKRENKKKKAKIRDIDMQNGESEDAMEVDPPKLNSKPANKPKPSINRNQKSRTFIPGLQNSTPKPSDDRNLPSTVANSQAQVALPLAALSFIPRQLMHKSYSGALTKNMKMEREVLENANMMDLAEALPSRKNEKNLES